MINSRPAATVTRTAQRLRGDTVIFSAPCLVSNYTIMFVYFRKGDMVSVHQRTAVQHDNGQGVCFRLNRFYAATVSKVGSGPGTSTRLRRAVICRSLRRSRKAASCKKKDLHSYQRARTDRLVRSFADGLTQKMLKVSTANRPTTQVGKKGFWQT